MKQPVKISSSEIVEMLKIEYPDAFEFLLFGSYAKNSEHCNSDIDILIRVESPIQQTKILNSSVKLPNYIDVFLQCGTSIISLRKRFALKDKTDNILSYSKKMWDKKNNITYSDMYFHINNVFSVKTTG